MRILLVALLALLLGAQPAFAQQDLGPGYVQTQFGPMGPAGRDLLQKVALAGLWEGPAGRMGLDKSANPKVREAGRHLIEGHADLDRRTVELARTLNVQLPTQPNESQQGWLNEMQQSTGPRFDQIFVDRLRAAHGKIFPVIGAVRSGTRNPVIRKLADEANVFVMGHMQMLESTGLVRYDRLAPPALPAAQDTSMYALAQANTGGGPTSPGLLWAVLAGTLALAGLTSYRILARRR